LRRGTISEACAATVLVLLAPLLAGATGCKKSEASTPLADVTASEHGFSPTSLKLAGGGPGSHGTVTFVRTSDKTCATEVVFPDLNLEKKLPLNEVVSVDLPTDAPKTLTFQCGMAMYKGAVVVTAK
jgi:plastocyanin domain-containing protein